MYTSSTLRYTCVYVGLTLLEVHLYVRHALRCTWMYGSHLEPECHLYAHLTPGSSLVDLYVCLTPYG